MINIAKLLKDAPKGMKLYSPLFGEVEFIGVFNDGETIKIKAFPEFSKSFFKDGRYFSFPDAECLLFPSKDCRTWEGWKLPVEPKFKVGDWVVSPNGSQYLIAYIDKEDNRYLFEINEYTGEPMHYEDVQVVDGQYHLWSVADAKDGDVLATDNGWTCIFKAFDGYGFSSYCFMDSQKWFCEVGAEGHTLDSRINGNIHPATKEQRDIFFHKMKEAGYQWDVDKKELCKIQPHYDIANFHAGMPVLVRDYNNSQWSYVQFSHLIAERNVGEGGFKFNACGIPYIQCIPFNEETKHLLGTTDMPDECYINW